MNATRKSVVFNLFVLASACLAAVAASAMPGSRKHDRDHSRYVQTNLVSDMPGVAAFTDPQLVNPWGISYGATSPFWVSDNNSGFSTLYNSAGVKQGLVVSIPPPAGGTPPAAPTGQVFNGTSGFQVAPGKPAVFIFATEDGTISGWNPGVNPTNAILAVDNSASGAVYKGLAIGSVGSNTYLYATNFRKARIEVYDSTFNSVPTPGKFVDDHIHRGYAPFNITNLNGYLFVTYAVQDAAKHDDVAGEGHGFVDIFDTSGNLVKRVARHGRLNSPWGLAIGPAGFGDNAGKLLVGNFGNGKIHVFDLDKDEWADNFDSDTLRLPDGSEVVIDGLWALIVGNGGSGGNANDIYFSAGPDGEMHGLFGSLSLAP